MYHAAKECGIIGGGPHWVEGARKISDNEWADQMEMMLEGENPDPVDVMRQLEHGV
jgi:hypothetical protein